MGQVDLTTAQFLVTDQRVQLSSWSEPPEAGGAFTRSHFGAGENEVPDPFLNKW